MARPLRFEYADAVYHVMARGDGGKAIFTAKDEHLLFLHRLGGRMWNILRPVRTRMEGSSRRRRAPRCAGAGIWATSRSGTGCCGHRRERPIEPTV